MRGIVPGGLDLFGPLDALASSPTPLPLADPAQFIYHAEQISGQDLANFFDVWLYQEGKPTSW